MPNGNGKAFRVKDETGRTTALVCLVCPAEKAAVVNRVHLVPEDTTVSTYRKMTHEMERHLAWHEEQFLQDAVPHSYGLWEPLLRYTDPARTIFGNQE